MDDVPRDPIAPHRSGRSLFRILMVAVAALVGMVTIFMAGFGVGVAVDQGIFRPDPVTAVEPTGVARPLEEAWALIHDKYVDQSQIDDKRMTAAAISAMLETLNDQGHTRYLAPEEVARHGEMVSGSYVGVGIEIEQRDKGIVVVAPIDQSPAQQAGIQAGDILVEVNGQRIDGMPIDQVVERVRGPEGSTVDLVFERPGQDAPVAVTLKRAKLDIVVVRWTMLPGEIVDIRIQQFSHGATAQLEQALQEAHQAGAKGVVLDLRNNPGGLVQEAIGVASRFLPKDTPVFISQTRDQSQRVHRAEAADVRTELPVVVLVNQGSASSSEIVSGALQESGRATVVGEQTFGTGTVLTQFGLSDGSAILLGTELWLTPDGDKIKENGISPDVRVSLPEDATPYVPVGSSPSADEIDADVQLQRALSVLRGDPVPIGASRGACLRCY